MWLVTDQGFYSAVADRKDPGRLIVRARARADLEALRDQIGDLRIRHTPDADYAYRATVSRGEWIAAVAVLTAGIDYPNFKEAVAERQGKVRATIYGRIWSVLLDLQRG